MYENATRGVWDSGTRNVPFDISILSWTVWIDFNSLHSSKVCGKKWHWLFYWFLAWDSKPRTRIVVIAERFDFCGTSWIFEHLCSKCYVSWKISKFMKSRCSCIWFCASLQTRSQNAGLISYNERLFLLCSSLILDTSWHCYRRDAGSNWLGIKSKPLPKSF